VLHSLLLSTKYVQISIYFFPGLQWISCTKPRKILKMEEVQHLRVYLTLRTVDGENCSFGREVCFSANKGG
jgi:hypothetical protein